jgi:hypothetical protein
VDDDAPRVADDPGRADEIRLRLPALASYARVARLAMTGIVVRNGFDYDEVEEVRIAVGEAFGVLVANAGVDDVIELVTMLDDGLDVAVCRMPARPIDELPELSRQIIAAVVDEATFDLPRGRIRLAKRIEGDR